jgi:hypothetical protein
MGHRLRLIRAGATGRAVFGMLLIVVGIFVGSGLDKTVESVVLARLPQWWIDFLARV